MVDHILCSPWEIVLILKRGIHALPHVNPARMEFRSDMRHSQVWSSALQSTSMTAQSKDSYRSDCIVLTNRSALGLKPSQTAHRCTSRLQAAQNSQTTTTDIPTSCESNFYTRTRVLKRDNRSCCICLLSHVQNIRLLVLGNELLNRLDVLLLGVGRAQVLELSPLVVLRLALCHTG